MHTFRIPTEIQFLKHWPFIRVSDDMGMLLIGFFFIFGMSWNIYLAFQPGGRFHNGDWFTPPSDRDHPLWFWLAFAIHVALILAGVSFVIAGCFGTKPWPMG